MAKNDFIVPVNECGRVTQGTHLLGNISATTDYRIDGLYEGNLFTTGKVIIGEASTFKGDISSSGADVWGFIEGNLQVDGVSTFYSTSKFKGILETKKFVVELGAEFNGTCTFLKEAQG